MSNLARLMMSVYRWLLACYPAEFRDEFGAEMLTVFTEAAHEAGNNPGRLLALFGRELRDWPGVVWRAHLWEGSKMMDVNFKKPEWFFYPGWVGSSLLSFPLAWLAYFPIIAVITHWVGDTIEVNGQQHITEDYFFSYIFFPTAFFLAGLLQYLLLRRYAQKMGWWILATASGSLLAVAATRLPPNILHSATGGTLIFALLGGAMGLCQWLFLRRFFPKSGWWIFASMLGWGLSILGILSPLKSDSVWGQLLAVSLPPGIVTAVAWWYLLKSAGLLENQET